MCTEIGHCFDYNSLDYNKLLVEESVSIKRFHYSLWGVSGVAISEKFRLSTFQTFSSTRWSFLLVSFNEGEGGKQSTSSL